MKIDCYSSFQEIRRSKALVKNEINKI